MQLRSIKEISSLRKKKVLVRLDLDAPVNHKGAVDETNDARLSCSLPTIRYLLKRGAEIVIVGHRGRPHGVKIAPLSLRPVVARLTQLLKTKSGISEEKVGGFDAYAFMVGNKWITVLENIRFDPGETRNTPQLAKELSKLADVYVNDAFAVSHRNHASLVGITNYIPAYAGLHLEKEIAVLGKVFKRPPRPLTLIMGGVKAETKLQVIKAFLARADYILLGTALANNFYKHLGFGIGSSRLDLGVQDSVSELLAQPRYRILDGSHAKDILLDPERMQHMDRALLAELKKRIILPFDVVVGSIDKNKSGIITQEKTELIAPDSNSIAKGPNAILDIGERTTRLYKEIIKRSKTIIWNGPLGMFELPPYNHGTYEIAKSVAASRGKAIVGGGDTIAAVESEHVTFKQNVFVSMGGGAMLEFLINPKLPGIVPLMKK